MALTRFLGVVATTIRWKLEGSGDDGESEPAERRPTDKWQDFEKATRTCCGGNG